MQEHYECLGLSPGATPAEIKAAYHRKLKEFPSHQYPQEFKAIRAAYEVLKKGEQLSDSQYFKLQPLAISLDESVVEQLRQRVTDRTAVSVEKLIHLTF